MPPVKVTVAKYLEDLRRNKDDKPEQVRDGIDAFLDLWGRVLELGLVDSTDEMDLALSKIERKGGLYKAAEG